MRLVDRHPHVVEVDLAVALAVLVAEHRQRPADLDPGRVHRAPGPSTAAGAGAPSGSVLPMTISTLQRVAAAPEIHHLRPLIT